MDKDLGPPSRTPAPQPSALDDIAPVRRSVTKPVVGRDAPEPHVKTDWPRDLRSETYMSRLKRKWAKRAAVAELRRLQALGGYDDARVIQ